MTETALHIDFETRGVLDLKEVGLHRYSRDANTSPWCMGWALDDGDVNLYTPSEPWGEFKNGTGFVHMHVEAGRPVIAHNAAFELAIWNSICVPRYGWPVLKPEQTFCTMAQCYAMGLPGALEDAALALGLPMKKDTEGRALMLRMARPRSKPGEPLVWWDEQDKLQRLYEYCRQDVRVERELHKRLLPLSAKERKVWLLDYKINQRGVAIDMPSVKGAIRVAEKIKDEAGQTLSAITDGAVQAVTALPSLKEWIAAQGVAVDGLAKQDIADLLSTETLPESVRRALIVRQEVGKASVAKFDVMERQAGEDNRLRNMYQYHGAGTGRWAGRAVQTHNLVRDMPPADVVEKVLAFVREGNHDAIDMLFGPPLTMISRCMRSFFVAPKGRKLISGDFANIEGRGQAWFAGEEWKVQAFISADNKTGPGIYELAYSRMFGVPVESIKDPSEERQVGKVSELAFGYQGGVGSFHVMAKTYGVKVSDEDADRFKEAWRDAHPKLAGVRETRYRRNGEPYETRVGGIWKHIQKAAINATSSPGEIYAVGHPGREAKYRVVGSFLWCLLPSGRAICFPYPKVLEGEYGPQLTYMTVPSQDDRQSGAIIHDQANANNWARVGTYGGALFNRIVQGFCRDFLADLMLELDARGAEIVLHTHDDANVEVDDDANTERKRALMEQLMRTPPAWAAGFPLFAKCKVMQRYGK